MLHPNNATKLAIESMLDYIDWLPDGSDDNFIKSKEDKIELSPSMQLVLEQLRDLKILQQALSNYEAAVKDALFEKMNNNVKEYSDDYIQIKCVWDKDEKKRFDLAKFKEEHQDLYDEYLKNETSAGYISIYWQDGEVSDA